LATTSHCKWRLPLLIRATNISLTPIARQAVLSAIPRVRKATMQPPHSYAGRGAAARSSTTSSYSSIRPTPTSCPAVAAHSAIHATSTSPITTPNYGCSRARSKAISAPAGPGAGMPTTGATTTARASFCPPRQRQSLSMKTGSNFSNTANPPICALPNQT